MIPKVHSKHVVIVNACLFVAALLLIFTGGMKLVSGIQTTEGTFFRMDPVITVLSRRELVMISGSFEIAIAAFIVFSERLSSLSKTVVIAWLATLFVMYRVGLRWEGEHLPCNCLGNIGALLRLSVNQTEALSGLILLYLLTFSYGYILYTEIMRRKGTIR